MADKQLLKGLDEEGLRYYDAVQKQRIQGLESQITGLSGSTQFLIIARCSEGYNSKEITATSQLDGTTYKATVEEGLALIFVPIPGPYKITNNLNDNEEIAIVGEPLMDEIEFTEFEATINVTIPEVLIGETIEAVNAEHRIEKVAESTSVELKVLFSGSWEIGVKGKSNIKKQTVTTDQKGETKSTTLTVENIPVLIVTCKEEDNGKTVKISKDSYNYERILKNRKASIALPEQGEWKILCDDYPDKTKTIDIKENKTYTIALRSSIFGIKVTQSESDPKQRIVVDTSGDLNGLTPITVNTQDGTVNYGDMEDTFLFQALNHVVLKSIDKSEEIELNPNDYTKKLEGENAPSAGINSNYNTFARADKLYIYQYSSGGFEYFFISDEKQDDKYEPIGFYNETNEADHIYLGCYGGSLDSQGRLRSVTGQRLKNRTSYTDFKAAATKVGSDYYMDTHAHINLYEIAYLMMVQNDDSQTAIGQGRDYNSGGTSEDQNQKLMGISSGWADKKGPVAYDPTTKAIKFMHIEDFWGNNLYFWEEGITFQNGKTYVRMRPPYPATTESSGTSTYTEVTGAATTSGYISASVCDNKWGRIPSAVSGSTSTYQCDTWNSGSGSTQYACTRGFDGLWCRYGNTFASTNHVLGARLSLIPS